MTDFQQLGALLIIPLILWVGGLAWQKVLAFAKDNDHKINTNSKLLFLIGLRAGGQPIYLRPAALQMIGLVTALAGCVAWLYEPQIAKKIADAVCLLSFTFVIIGLVILDVNERLKK